MKINSIITLCFMMPALMYSQVTMVVEAKAQNVVNAVGVTEVTAVEDLMREHGVVNRALLIYEEMYKRLMADNYAQADLLNKTAKIFRAFVENYHETLEEVYVFPKFEKAGVMFDLVRVLQEQHNIGRAHTDFFLAHSNVEELKDLEMRQKMCAMLMSHVNMYRRHSAREDTVLFPAFKTLVTKEEYDSLSEIFEDKEHGLFGKAGFTSVVESIAAIEKELGIYTLSRP